MKNEQWTVIIDDRRYVCNTELHAKEMAVKIKNIDGIMPLVEFAGVTERADVIWNLDNYKPFIF